MRRQPLSWLVIMLSAAGLTRWAVGAPSARPPVPVLRQRLDEILSSGYQLTEPPQARLDEMLIRALRALRDMLGQISEAGPLTGLPGWAKPVLVGILFVLLGLMIAHIVASLRGLLQETRDRRGQTEPEPHTLDPRSVLRSAEAAFQQGEHDRAIRLLYRAVVLRLDRLGLLSHDPARTNWENLRALSLADADTRNAMALLTREVDACTYGGRAASSRTWERAREWANVLWRAERPA